jgi:hypothetical protein
MIDFLKDFKVIAWDFDKTLIDHEYSPRFWQYIRDNPYNQTHHVVTLRTHSMVTYIKHDMNFHDHGLLDLFDGIHYPEDEAYESYVDARGNVGSDHPYLTFKGKTCRNIGADILIDDMEAIGISEAGCDAFGVPYIHPDRLFD